MEALKNVHERAPMLARSRRRRNAGKRGQRISLIRLRVEHALRRGRLSLSET
jgi:hypothetical protein